MASSETPQRQRGRLWLSVGEGAAVLAVVIAALSFWDSHRERTNEAARQEAAARAATQGKALVLEAAVEAGGRKLLLKAVEPRQVIQSQRYGFPSAVLGHPVDLTAATPEIDGAWIAPGLEKALNAARAPRSGASRMPVAIITDYVEDGVVREDRSVYLIGYSWRGRLLGGREIALQGMALQHRHASGDLNAVVNRQWKGPA